MSDQTSSPCTCLACQAGLAVTCAATEKRIRNDQRRLDLRELQATARDLAWLLEQLPLDQPAHTIDTRKLVGNLEKLHRHARRLITLSERRTTP